MTLVNHETGEIVDLDPAAAERRAERIRLRLDVIADSYDAVMPMIREAIAARDDLALGYRSVGDYVSDRFGGALQRLGVEMRRAVVQELTEAGMSTRAIAPIVGVSNKTVSLDQRAGVTSVTPDPATATVPEPWAKESTSVAVHPQGGAVDDADLSGGAVDEVAAAPRPAASVVGIDGKTYSRPTPVNHRARADAAVADFPELAYYRAKGDLEHCWRLAEKLRDYRDRGELDERLDNLRKSIAYDRGDLPPAAHAATPQPTTCPTCGQDTTNARSAS